MALTAAQLTERLGGVVDANSARIEQALDYSQSRVDRIRGPEYDPARPVQTASWDILGRVAGWPLTLAISTPVQEVREVRVRGNPIEPESWTLDYRVGILQVRIWIVWNMVVEMDYIPEDDRPLRDSVQGDIAAMYWGAQQQYGPGGESQRPEFNRDAMEARALRRLELIGMGIRRPSRIFYKAGQGGG